MSHKSEKLKNCSVQNYIYFEKSQKARSQGRAQGHAQVCARVNQLLLRRVITLQFSPGHPLYEQILQRTRKKIEDLAACKHVLHNKPRHAARTLFPRNLSRHLF